MEYKGNGWYYEGEFDTEHNTFLVMTELKWNNDIANSKVIGYLALGFGHLCLNMERFLNYIKLQQLN